jgi:Acyl-CoA dehydrogenase, C-terminal domain
VALPIARPARLAAPLWCDTFFEVAAHALATVSLGIARAAIDELTALAAAKTPNFRSTPLRDRPAMSRYLLSSWPYLLDAACEIPADVSAIGGVATGQSGAR